MNNKKYQLKTRDLRNTCNPSIFKFTSTADVKPLQGMIGQDRALKALSLGLDIDNSGYNVYLSGIAGTGKATLAHQVIKKKAKKEAVPSDWCYVHNFNNADSPLALELPPGKGKQFKDEVSEQVEKTIRSIVKALESEEFEYKKNQILGGFVEETNHMYLKLEEEARSYGYTISRNESGITSIPMKNGEPLNQDDFIGMSEEERSEIIKKGAVVQDKLNEAFRQYKELEKILKEKIKQLEYKTASEAASSFFNKLFDKYKSIAPVFEYLQAMQEDMLKNLDSLTKQEEDSSLNLFKSLTRRSAMRKYEVNLVVDNSSLKHAPVVFETNPTYSNLFGQIEYEGEFGILATDFSKIKSGSIHQANGGYLVLNVYDLLNNYYVWNTLKKVIKNREIRIESVSRMIGLNNAETLQPEPIPCHVKVILIGEPIYYYMLYSYDDEFQKIFKIRADFDTEMERTRKNINDYARFISSVCTGENLRHFTPQAVAEVVNYGSRMAEHRNKLTTSFNRIVEIIYEADCWASYDNTELVEEEHVKKAISEKKYRSSLYEDRVHEYIKQETILINTDGFKTGEINGLAVYEMGEYAFGKPVKITAKTFMGEKGLVNIERETLMSGSIHSKGVLTLNGYMGFQYAQDKPLSLSASLTFEQSYSGIEGDSASSAELYALLSSLADVPVYQGIAVTGSVNQNGEIQAVGGINQKIEGFFRVCKEQGLNGKQGVIIPTANLNELMLESEVVEAVRNNMFNVWAVAHIDQGIEILTGVPAGVRDINGLFPLGSIHYLVDNKLRQWNYKRLSGTYFREKNVPRRRRGSW